MGGPPYPLETMLRIHFLQLWNSRSDQGVRDDLLGIIPFHSFSKIDELVQGQTPDATTILRFRHCLEEHDLARQTFEKVVEQLEAAGLLIRQLWIRTPGLGGNISVGTTFLEISSPP